MHVSVANLLTRVFQWRYVGQIDLGQIRQKTHRNCLAEVNPCTRCSQFQHLSCLATNISPFFLYTLTYYVSFMICVCVCNICYFYATYHLMLYVFIYIDTHLSIGGSLDLVL